MIHYPSSSLAGYLSKRKKQHFVEYKLVLADYGAISGACYGVEGIPARWLEKVENRLSIENMAAKLWEVKAELISA